MIRNIRLQIFVDNEVYLKVREYQRQNKQQTEARACYMMLKDFKEPSMDEYGLPINVNQLSKALESSHSENDKLKTKIEELQFAIKNIYGKQFKEISVVGKEEKMKVPR